MTHTPIAYRPDIDGLRAIAIGTVVFYHAFPSALPGGFIGVDIFFIISGFLISSIIFVQMAKGRFSFREFYVRRVCRIFPALAVVLFLTMAAGWLWLLSSDWQRLGEHVRGGAFFMANFVLAGEAGYFDQAAELKPLLHLWSLAIEEQFYLAWPLLAFVAYRFRFALPLLIVIALAASFGFNVARIANKPVATFFLPGTRVWELLVGCLLAYRAHFPTNGLGRVIALGEAKVPVNVRAACGLALIVIGLVVINKQQLFPGWWALFPTLGAALLISAGPTAYINRLLLAHRLMIFIGLISYPLYLWHWPMLSLATIYVGGVPSVEIRAALVVASIAAAAATYYFLERPIRFGAVPRRKAAVILVTICLMIGGAGHLTAKAVIPSHASSYGTDPIAAAAGEWQYPTPILAAETYRRHKLLKMSNTTGPEGVLFLGDSNMEQYWPRIEVLGQRPDIVARKTIYFLTFGGCPPLPDVTEVNHPYCAGFVDAGLELVRERDIKTVVVGAHWWSYFTQQAVYEYKGQRLTSAEGGDKSLDAFVGMVRTWIAEGRKVYVVLNIPYGNQMDPKNMIRRHLTSFEVTSRPVMLANLQKQVEFTRRMRLALEAVGAETIDPLAYLCDKDGICPTVTREGEPIYKDAGHLRPTYVRSQVTFVDRLLQ